VAGPGRTVRFPPGHGTLLVPVDDRRAARAALALTTTCRPLSLTVQVLTRTAVTVAGPWVLPGRRLTWTPPLDPGSWTALLDAWAASLGPFDALVVHERKQESRAGVTALLLRSGTGIAVVKVRPSSSDRLAREVAVLTALDGQLATVHVPRLLADGSTDGWTWLAMSPLTSRVHRPAWRADVPALEGELARRLAPVLPAADVPKAWSPMHGDLTPWNLRRDRAGTFLLDWEDAAWGPPHADSVYFRATRSAIGGPGAAWQPDDAEAREYWSAVVAARNPADRDADLGRRLLAVLSSSAS
jgi:aminoglycoside phosphotransferase (APT) family kinase protein